MESVILLNADENTILKVINWKKAITLLYKEKAIVIAYSKKIIRTVNQAIKLPKIIKLVKMVNHIFSVKAPFSKRNILIRDGYQCGYCLSKKQPMTIDHIMPKCRGGKSTFLNCVCACESCNRRKADKTLEQSGLMLLKKIYHPTVRDFLYLKITDERVLEALQHFRKRYE